MAQPTAPRMRWSPVRLSGCTDDFRKWEISVMGQRDYFLVIRIASQGERVTFDAWVPEKFIKALLDFCKNGPLEYHPQITQLELTAQVYTAFFRDEGYHAIDDQIVNGLRNWGLHVRGTLHLRATWVVYCPRLVLLYWYCFKDSN